VSYHGQFISPFIDLLPLDETLLLHHKVVRLGKPNSQQVRVLWKWMEGTTRGNVYLTGLDRDIWSKDADLDDMLTLEAPAADDFFTSKTSVWLIHVYHNLIGRYIHVGHHPLWIPAKVTAVALIDSYRKRRRKNTRETRCVS
jgi:hypothetical protein